MRQVSGVKCKFLAFVAQGLRRRLDVASSLFNPAVSKKGKSERRRYNGCVDPDKPCGRVGERWLKGFRILLPKQKG